jgi:hypothetical protein
MSHALTGSPGAILRPKDDKNIEEHAVPGLLFVFAVMIIGLIVELCARPTCLVAMCERY